MAIRNNMEKNILDSLIGQRPSGRGDGGDEVGRGRVNESGGYGWGARRNNIPIEGYYDKPIGWDTGFENIPISEAYTESPDYSRWNKALHSKWRAAQENMFSPEWWNQYEWAGDERRRPGRFARNEEEKQRTLENARKEFERMYRFAERTGSGHHIQMPWARKEVERGTGGLKRFENGPMRRDNVQSPIDLLLGMRNLQNINKSPQIGQKPPRNRWRELG